MIQSSRTPAELLERRYREAVELRNGNWTAVLDTMLAHCSVRAYRPDPLRPGTLRTLIAAAQSAPTSSNLQTWSVVAVEDPARKRRLASWAGEQKHIVDCPLFLVWLADLQRITTIGEAIGRPTAATDYLETTLIAVIDAALAAQNALVAAESLGLGTVYIGAVRNHPEEVAAELGLPPKVFPVVGLCVGYPEPARPAAVKPRLPQSVVCHGERYGTDLSADAIEGYNGRLEAFQESQGMSRVPWTEQATARLRGPESMSGRHRLRDAFGELGFKLR